jgi:transcriptional regulator with XRE-family HTH domain
MGGYQEITNRDDRETGRIVMTDPVQNAPIAAFLDLLVDQIDPHRSTQTPDTLVDRVLCGRWLALRRLKKGLSAEDLAATAGVTAEHLKLLEAGVANPILLSNSALQILGGKLADRTRNARWIQQVGQVALGDDRASDAKLIEDVRADLGLMGPPPQDELVYQILAFLREGENHQHNIRRHTHKYADIPEFVDVMLDLVEAKWIVPTSERPDPGRSSEPQQYYKLMPRGQFELEAEYQRRETLRGAWNFGSIPGIFSRLREAQPT